ncbi:MAG: CHAT domain-containing protein, partial [Frankiaceae bacterium]
PASFAAAMVGLRILDDFRATMVATDLRARVSGLRTELVELGLRNALHTGRPARVLEWAELGRGRHLLERPARPPADPILTQQLAELRATVQEVDEHTGSARPAGVLLQRQAALERNIRDHCRRQRGALSMAQPACPAPAELSRSLGAAALVEFAEADQTLHAVTVVAGRTRLYDLGPVAPLRDLVQWLPFALRRLARQPAKPASTAAALALLRSTAGQLDAALLRPLAETLGDRPLVLVPTGILQSMPWALLPSGRGRAITVAPSATLWHAARQRASASGPTVVVAGPGLPGALQEAQEIAALHGVAPLIGPSASVATVADALDGAGLAHVAAHGQVRADNPLFSALRLSDGPLTVYDLERLRRGPDTVVLAACESGRNVVLAGDELLGLSSAFLARDTRQLIASVVPVPDAETAPLMVSFHRELVGGASPAVALMHAQQSIDFGEPAALAAAAGFVCLGVGLAPA